MVAIVAGNSLGLSLTSLATHGQDGVVGPASSRGRNGEQIYVNSENGNLVVQDQDEYVAATGLDISGLRTYNSQAKLIAGVPDSWAVGPMRLKVTLPTSWGAGTMTRTDIDGAEASYAWNSAKGGYLTTMGAGAYDVITKDVANNQYIWTDGDTQAKEYYDATGKLLKSLDADGNTVTYGRDASGRLVSATGAGGENFTIHYTAAGDLQDVTTTLPGGSATKRVAYQYDGSHRLTQVTVDITPADGSTADGASYWTQYAYIGTSSLINTISQTDQSSVTFTYDASNRVKTVTASNSDGVARVMTFSYDSATQTTITDPANASIVMQTDSSGRLKQINIAGQLEHSFTYFGTTDDLQSVTDAVGNVVTYGEDSVAGTLTSRSDSLGLGFSRRYNDSNQVTSHTVNGGGTSTYVYAAASAIHPHYSVSGAGRVTEYVYNTKGERTGILVYDNIYSGARTDSALGTWAAAQPVDSIGRTDYTYLYGQLQSSIAYGAVLASHAGDTANAQNSTTSFTYNTQGQLLTTDEPGLNGPTLGVTTYAYDGMGRQVSFKDTLGRLATTSYDDASNKTTVTFANGLVTASTWDKSGNLISEVNSGAVLGSTSTSYAYDADNRLIMKTDGAGNRSFRLWDGEGKLIGEVDGDGTLTEYVYDIGDRLTRTIKYTTAVPLTSMYSSTTGKALNPTLASIRPAAAPATDMCTWKAYDITGRLLKTVDAEGAVTEYTYDSSSNVIQTKQYANALTATQMSALGNMPTAAAITPTADATNDRVTRNFVDADNLLTGTLDADGWLQEFVHDGASRLAQQTQFATITSAADRASGSFATLRAQASAGTGHEVTTYLYDAKGQRTGVIDARGYLTETTYDIDERATSTIRYANLAKTPYTPSSTIASVRPATTAQDIKTSWQYDDLDRVYTTTDARNTVTTNTYDAAGNLTLQVASSNVSADSRAVVARNYDELGRMTKDASAQNYSVSGMTKAAVYTYDGAGNRISATDATGNKTLFYYDAENRLVYSVDPLGGVIEYDYNTLGNNTAQVRYQKAISTTGLVGGAVTSTLTTRINGVKNPVLDSRVDYTYTRDGKVASTKDARGNTSYVFHDAFDEPIYIVDGAGGSTANKYDNNGRLVQATRYTNPVAGVTATTTVGQLQSLISPDTVNKSDQTVNSVYDMDGRLTATVNGLGEVVKFKYDGNGNVIESRAYIARLSGWSPGSPINTIDGADDRWVRTAYDAFNRAIYTMDGNGAVTTYKYDTNGNVLERRAYANVISTSGFAAQTLPVASTADRWTVNLYDTANRLQWTEDGTGAVTRYFYDDDGNVTQEVQYAKLLTPGSLPSAATATSGSDRITNYFYDVMGRLAYTLDSLKQVTGLIYDANGNVIKKLQYFKAATTAPAIGTIPSTFAPPASNPSDCVICMAYDAENRLVYAVDGAGDVTENVYDGCGNISKVVQHAVKITGTSTDVATIKGLLGAANADDRAVSNSFDSDNRLKTSTEGIGNVITYTYDGLDRVQSSVEGGTRTTSYVYDGAGRIIKVTDALNNFEQYGYDGVGNKVSFTNKMGAVWTYDFDSAGNLTDEHTPLVDVYSMTDATIGAPTVQTVSIVTHNAYDGLGNLTSRTEAYGRVVEQRTTGYVYDGAGRQIRTNFPSFSTYSAETDSALALNGQAAAATRSEAMSTPFSETYYDAFGNATGSKDVGGKYSYKVYDVIGQVQYEMDALGYVTGYLYDPFGGATSITHYFNSKAPPAGAKSITATQAKPTASSGNDRVLAMTYDKAGRVLTVSQPSAYMYDPDGTTQTYTTSSVTTNTYNAFGQIASVTQDRKYVGGTDPTEYRYYDQAGNLKATVDAANYVTAYSYDVLGNLTQKTEFNKAYVGSPSMLPGATPPTPALDNNNDRTTTYSYDALGRKTSETKKNVESTNQDTFVTSRSDITTTYSYDAVGNQVSVTNAAGTGYTYYDVLGRVTAMAQPSRVGETTGSTLTPLTILRRDAYGDAIQTIDYTQGASTANATAYSAGPTDARDRTTFMVYDLAGHNTHTRDAAGADHYASYDVFGHKVKEWQSLGAGSSTVTIFKAYKYDELGRLTRIVEPGSNAIGTGATVSIVAQNTVNTVIATDMTYNGFGEMVSRSVGGNAGESWEYDVAGRVWRTNADGGVYKIYLYDQLGRRTAELQSAGGAVDKDLAALPVGTAASDGTLRRTDFKYDTVGNVTKVTEPGRLESYSNVNVRDTTVTAAITVPNAAFFDGSDWVWTQSSSLTLSWAPTTGLGAGEIRVTVQYYAATATIDGQGNTVFVQGPQRTATNYFRSEDASSGEWTELGQDVMGGSSGGFYSVINVTVEKLRADGIWQQIASNPPAASGGNVLEVEKVSGVVSQDIQVLDTQTQGAQWVTIPKTLWYDFGDKYQVDLRAYSSSRYQYRLLGGMAGGAQTTVFTGNLWDTATAYTGADVAQRPVVNRTYDRWGNALTVSDPRNSAWLTKYEYNFNDQMVRQSLPLNAQGSEALTLATTVYYDKLGRQLGTTDANGHTNRVRYDSQGNVTDEIHADTGHIQNYYDTWGDRVITADAMNNATTFAYNKLGLLTDVVHASSTWYNSALSGSGVALSFGGTGYLVEHTDWDAAGRKTAQTDTGGNVTQYQNDLRGNIVKVTLPTGAVQVTTAYDYLGRKVAETDGTNSAGGTQKWTYDYFGHTVTHTNLAGTLSNYTYDRAGQLKSLTGAAGGQSLTYSYDAAGQLAQINDAAIHQTTSYTYDWSGNKTSEQVLNNGVVYQDNHMAYDALGRLRWVGDDHSQVNFAYDLVGNRTHITTHVINVTGLASYSNDEDRYYLYDSMNRQTAVDAIDAAGNVNVSQGHQLTYDLNGNRKTDTHYGPGVLYNVKYASGGQTIQSVTYSSRSDAYVVEQYDYDALNRIISIERVGSGDRYWDPDAHTWETPVQIDSRSYDKAGRLVHSGAPTYVPAQYLGALYGKDANGNTIIGNGSQIRNTYYDANGRLVRQEAQNNSGSLGYITDNQVWDAAGNLTRYGVTMSGVTNTYTTTLAKFDGYKEATVSGASTVLRPGNTASTYDVNGFLAAVSSTTSPADNRTFINDAAGQVLATMQGGNLERELIVNGEVLAQYGSGVDPITPRDPNGHPNFDTNIANFEFGYRSITPNYPSATPGMYTVRLGDTLRTIAQSAYGDADMWFEIADANHIMGDAGLRVGATIVIPSAVSNFNSTNTFTPYDPSKIVGDTTPYLPKPPVHFDPFGALFAAVIAVIVTIYTAGAAASALAPATSQLGMAGAWNAGLSVIGAGSSLTGMTTGIAMTAGAVGGAVGSLAGQVVNEGFGNQDGLDWGQVVLGAVSGGAAASLAQSGMLPGAANAVARAAVTSTIVQGVSVATGIQKSFSWQAVAASAIGAGVGQAVAQGMEGSKFGAFGVRAASGLAAGAATAVARGGRVSELQVAVDAFGHALGQGLVDQSQPQGVGPWSDPNEVNGMDLASDQTYETRRAQVSVQPRRPTTIVGEDGMEYDARSLERGDIFFRHDPTTPGSYGAPMKSNGPSLIDRGLDFIEGAIKGTGGWINETFIKPNGSTNELVQMAGLPGSPKSYAPFEDGFPYSDPTPNPPNAPTAVASAWDGKSGVYADNTSHPFYGTLQYQIAKELPGDFAIFGAPEVALAKLPLAGRVITGGERLLGEGTAGTLRTFEGVDVAATEAAIPPGQWMTVNEAMSARARAYQTQITGRTGEAYIVYGVKFDGVAPGAYLDAKSAYAQFVGKDGNFANWWRGSDSLLEQAERQLAVGGGAEIRWHFAEESAAIAAQRLLIQNNITGIRVIHTPPIGKF